MKKSKKAYSPEKKPYIYIYKKLILGSGQKTQKRGFLPLLLQFAPLALNLLDSMGGRSIKSPPYRSPLRHPRRMY